jgi:iron complex transport system substrate-binding protein
MRICSLLPSATEIVAELGHLDSLVGVSEECRWPAEVIGKPVVTAARIDPQQLASVEIDDLVKASVADGRSLYTVDADLIRELDPDVLITQDLCAVCAVSSHDLASACPVEAEVISLDPGTLDAVAESVITLASRLGTLSRGHEVAAEMRGKVAAVESAVDGLRRKPVFVAEWIDPPYCAGHWVPDMIDSAGGTSVLGRSGEPSRVTTWDAVNERQPELVVVAPCGFDADEAARRAADLSLPCRAVAVDADSYYSRPAPRLADGVRQLAHLLHPDHVPDPGLPMIQLDPGPSTAARRQRQPATSRTARR